MRGIRILLAASAMLVVLQGTVHAQPTKAAARCWGEPHDVSVGTMYEIWADGLPTRPALNVFVSDDLGTIGFPVGVRPSGILDGIYWNARTSGVATIRITGPVGHNTKVYATCEADVYA